MALTDGQVSNLEHQTGWQATAHTKDGNYAVIMRGDKDYHVFDGASHIGSLAYRMNVIVQMFANGDLTLLRGTIPDKENPS
ncbi:MAG TPA: hypothetical protein VKR59_07740 [Terriglobales bacterium]|nr:hypothetical protein [Terriglobales bacterium]